MNPKHLFRSDDGERFTRQCNGKYAMDNSKMHIKHLWDYEALIRCGFVDSLDKCKIVKVEPRGDGHGNGDFDE